MSKTLVFGLVRGLLCGWVVRGKHSVQCGAETLLLQAHDIRVCILAESRKKCRLTSDLIAGSHQQAMASIRPERQCAPSDGELICDSYSQYSSVDS